MWGLWGKTHGWVDLREVFGQACTFREENFPLFMVDEGKFQLMVFFEIYVDCDLRNCLVLTLQTLRIPSLDPDTAVSSSRSVSSCACSASLTTIPPRPP